MKKILITGMTGFAGSFLAEHLLTLPDAQIIGTFHSENSLVNVAHMKDTLDLVKVDLQDKDALHALIADKRPDEVYHLAALASPSLSFKNPGETLTNNIAIQVNLFEALRIENLTQTKILIVSSAEIYGIVSSEDLPIDENTPLCPTSPYAVSKIAQDYLGLQYFLSYKMPIIRVRPFNHVGPRQAPNFVISSFAKRIVDIEKGVTEPILKVGTLDTKRDFTDVRDMVRAYVLLMEKGTPGEAYNIGSGVSHKIEDVLRTMLSFSDKEIRVEKDQELVRPSDNPELLCDCRKMRTITNWEPQIPFEQTLKDTLDYWRNIE